MFGVRGRIVIVGPLLGPIFVLSFFLLAVLILGYPIGTAWAHGGGAPRLTNVEAGPYWVSVWTQPDPLRVGQAHVTVAVSVPSDSGSAGREAGPPVLDAVVQVAYRPLDWDGETLTAQATHEGAANKLFYEADLELPEAGRWLVVIETEGPRGAGSASFEAQISPDGGSNLIWMGGLGLVALLAVWTVHRYRGQRSRE